MTTVYRLTNGEDGRTARRESASCKQVLKAEDARTHERFEEAAGLYDAQFRQRTEGPLAPHVRNRRTETYTAWGYRLRGLNQYQAAVEAYQRLGTDARETARVKGLLLATYREWGDKLRAAKNFSWAINAYKRLGTAGDSGAAKALVADSHREWGDDRRSAGDYQAAVEQYSVVLTDFPDVPAAAELTRAGLTAIVQAARALTENGKPCDALPILDTLAKAGQPFSGNASDLTPGALFACGDLRYSEGKFDEAMTHLRSLRTRFPQSGLAARADDRLIDAEVAKVGRQPTSNLPAPQRTGGAAGGSTVLTVRNASPRPLEVLLSGPSSKRITLDRCRDCIEGYIPVGDCKGTQVEIALAPGEYKAVARVTDGASVTPFSGTWPISASTRYTECLYIRMHFGP